MEWKLFELRLKIKSAKEKTSNLFRLINRSGMEDSNISLPAPAFATSSSKPANSFNKPFIETELYRAKAAAYARTLSSQPK